MIVAPENSAAVLMRFLVVPRVVRRDVRRFAPRACLPA